jgi:glucose-6-phosphate 1-dehydrogenase
MIHGKEVVGYRDEPGVAANSSTVTYAAIKFFIDNWRSEGRAVLFARRQINGQTGNRDRDSL